MNFKKIILILVAIIMVAVIVLLVVSIVEKNAGRSALAKRIFALGGDNQGTTVEELKAAIAQYEKRIEHHVNDAAQTGIYWKLLAVRLQDRSLHGEALEALKNAVYYLPEDPAVQYYTGLSAAVMAKSTQIYPGNDDRVRQEYFALAEKAYLRAIELDPNYMQPRYGLGVLYVFELNKSEAAIPHLERYLEIFRNDVDAMFVLARACVVLHDYQTAIDLYDRIIAVSKDEVKRNEAQKNRQTVMGQIRG
jgi:tetratricopeptide (TPR) repeat protein